MNGIRFISLSLVLTLVVSLEACAPKKRDVAGYQTTSDKLDQVSNDENPVSFKAKRSLAFIHDAQEKIAANNLPEARSDLYHADTLLNYARAELPYQEFRIQLQSTKRTLSNSQGPGRSSDMIPLYTKLTVLERTDRKQARKIRAKVDEANKLFLAGKSDEALKSLEGINDLLIVSEVAIPAEKASNKVNEALQLLNKDQTQQALELLKNLEKEIQVSFTETLKDSNARVISSDQTTGQ